MRWLALAIGGGMLVGASTVVGAEVRVYPATTKVLKDGRTGPGGSTAVMEAARNEWDAFQVAIEAGPGEPLSGVTVEVRDLRGPGGARVPATAFELYLEHYVMIERPSYCEFAFNFTCADHPEYGRVAGEYPDALVPFVDPYSDAHAPVGAPFDVGAGDLATVWVDLHVPADAPAGDYSGSLAVLAGTRTLATVPVTLTVWDFDLPAERTITTAYSMSWTAPERYHACPDATTADRIRRNYELEVHRHRIDLTRYDFKLDLSTCGTGPGGGPDVTSLDQWMAPRLDGSYFPDGAGVRKFSLGRFEPGDGTSGLDEAAWSACAKAMAEHLQQRGWLDRVYLYSSDEPWMPSHAGAIKRIVDDVTRLRAASPLWAGTVMVTGPWLEPLDGYVDIWCPVTPMYCETCWPEGSWAPREKYEEEMAKGRALWFYVCNANFPPTLGYDVDTATGYEPRLLKWQAWHEGATGFLYWRMTYWQDPDTWHVLANDAEFGPVFARMGDGILIYPGDHHGTTVGAGSPPEVSIDGPVVSFRLKQIREGLEDWEVFRMAEALGAGAYARAQVERAVVRFGDMLTEDFDPADRPWTLDEQVLLDARRNVSRKVQHILHPDRWPDPEPATPDPGPDSYLEPDAAAPGTDVAAPDPGHAGKASNGCMAGAGAGAAGALAGLLALLSMLLGACVPMPVKDECRERVNACLQGCPPATRGPEGGTGLGPVDTRTSCERACHERCY